jgi:hypothetical protein
VDIIQGNTVLIRQSGEILNDSPNQLAFRRVGKAQAPGTLEEVFLPPSNASTETKGMEQGVVK